MHEYSRCLLSRTNADTLSAEKVAEMHIEKNAGCDSILKKKHAHTYEFVSCHCHHVFTFLHISTINKTSAPYLVTDVSSSAPCTCRYIIGGGCSMHYRLLYGFFLFHLIFPLKLRHNGCSSPLDRCALYLGFSDIFIKHLSMLED